MKKLKYILILSLLLVPVGFVKAANDVTLDAATNIELTSPAMTLVLSSGSSFSSMSVTASTVAFTISAGGTITLTSADKYILNNSHNTYGTYDSTCSSSGSSVTYSIPSGEIDGTITFTPGTALCDAGAGTTSSSGGGGSGGTPITSAQPTTGTQAITKTVTGTTGGSVATTDNKAGMTVPSGLATGNLSMNITPQASSSYGTPASNYSAVASQVYDYSLSAGGVTLTQFSKAVTLTFQYTDTDISGLDESSLKVYYWDTAQNKWVLVGGTVDTVNNTLTAEVTHFTIYGIFALKTAAITGAETGDLIKLQCPSGADVNNPCKSVYYLGSNSKRYVFPNETTYKSWYLDFSGVKTVNSNTMASYSIGGNVTMRPGTNLIKITTDPKVYAVELGGKLRWVESETVAKKLYGDNWIKKIVDVSDAFFVNYDASEAVVNKVSDSHPVGTLIKYAGSNNKYYLAAGPVKRLFTTNTAFTNNGFRDEFVLTTDITYNDGANITGAESALKTTAGP